MPAPEHAGHRACDRERSAESGKGHPAALQTRRTTAGRSNRRTISPPRIALRARSVFSLLVVGLCAPLAAAQPAQSPRHPGEWAWKPITGGNGLDVRYVFYPAADTRNDGVVIRLLNERPMTIRYRFTVIFVAEDDSRVEAPVRGTLGPDAMATGDAAGLFWIPFVDGRSIASVGLRGLRVWPAASAP